MVEKWTAKIESKKFSELVDNISQFIDDTNINITKDGLKIKTADRTMVCFIDTTIPTSQFETYSVSEDLDIGLNLVNLATILKRGGKAEKLSLTYNDDGTLTVGFNGDRKFTIPQLSVSKETPSVDGLKYTCKTTIKSDLLKTAIADSDIMGETLNIGLENDRIEFSAKGDVQNYVQKIYKGTDQIINIEGSGNARYSLEYLKKLKHLSDEITMELGKDSPLKISCNNGISFSFILAPRVSEEEIESPKKPKPKDEETDEEEEEIEDTEDDEDEEEE